jgi:hypothetical protein
MSAATLFMAGAAISLLAFSGVLIYAMAAFREWANRTERKAAAVAGADGRQE